jgi:hypothetical protein
MARATELDVTTHNVAPSLIYKVGSCFFDSPVGACLRRESEHIQGVSFPVTQGSDTFNVDASGYGRIRGCSCSQKNNRAHSDDRQLEGGSDCAAALSVSSTRSGRT